VNRSILIVRPQPGASATEKRATALGLRPIVAPLFSVRPLDWEAPDPAGFDAVLLTSANAARHGGAQMRLLTALPCYAVGEATAAAAENTGFGDLRAGPSDGPAAVAMMAKDGVKRAFHPCGRDHVDLAQAGIAIERRPVYASDEVASLPVAAEAAIAAGALILAHSPRAGALLARLIPDRSGSALAAISAAAADAAGGGWRSKAVAPSPSDEALLELAAKLCQIGGPEPGSGA
jgi:uroporphyrinogen-III synthase